MAKLGIMTKTDARDQMQQQDEEENGENDDGLF